MLKCKRMERDVKQVKSNFRLRSTPLHSHSSSRVSMHNTPIKVKGNLSKYPNLDYAITYPSSKGDYIIIITG